MSKLILGVLLSFLAIGTKAQLTETTVSSVPTVIGSFNASFGSQATLIQKIKDKDTIYTLKFKNYNDKALHEISFSEKGGALNSLYKILAAFFYPENKKNKDYKKTFKLGEEDITCTMELAGNRSVVFSTNEGYFLINEKELNKLFRK